jgi:hypothetical protein
MSSNIPFNKKESEFRKFILSVLLYDLFLAFKKISDNKIGENHDFNGYEI